MSTQNWAIDFRGDNRANMYRLKETLATCTSPYQEILIADTFTYGRALFLDGVPQSSATDEHIYHEAFVHPAMVAATHPTTIFVAGGGEGALLREILKHNTVQRVVMVDIDDVVVNLAKQYLGDWHKGSFEDSRVQLLHEDARAYLSNTSLQFDCIFVDMTDPLEGSPAASLFTSEFFQIAKSRLAPNGIFAMQAETTDIGEHIPHISIIKTLKQCFSTVMPYQTMIPFFGLGWGFALATDAYIEEEFKPSAIAKTLLERGCNGLQFYDAESHLHMFSLPKHIRAAISNPEFGDIITDRNPLIVD